ncbi:MAG: hypothetical protein A2268_08545 [Candidatus Raymondbacteria bacterium RifOxyA12_full_50_37]|uniref:STAS domain-containing protein n=1 Tax=Candidatus Raymondbacteria bacterium RIFOXYD12_FULL_49_13 TaxID=1817890 RepID=A0A1F7FK91_UNCRA|nr:MAG: hypothetical protein A2268_08545 [Candidatus Raymondbacteria bacterium RifOxyA12_full_50_37]OGJ90832.1 MAG: hypothetical protein A2248_07120 [Candidatus Raymondbacteria bacterium RIFOXYA2_FULL_49_16]OGJ98640.1 MAG: hypothetical protein A2453_05065 [Candidatus Raymondbacteria bacterium RIFOXYC2_FULL_50_21]OGK00408.1 MAG: hypothetical protein A2350_14945 [Candidatus Raymondbacteria bacterium RifOxyB12_full_50_8]OGK05246.1 MAG: hypothetical protein A2487_11005 [Candidatus Raymondbacteria b
MAQQISAAARSFLESCALAKAITGESPQLGTKCWMVYQDENGSLRKECAKCPYAAESLKGDSISVDQHDTHTVVSLGETLNDKRILELKKILEGLLAKEIKTIFLDCSSLIAIHSGGLGVVLRAFKEQKEKKRNLFLVNPTPAVTAILESTLLSRVFQSVLSIENTLNVLGRKEEEERSGEAQRKEEERKKQLEEARSIRCWDFFKGHNPANATACAECYYKHANAERPCWLIVGQVEGVEFEYISEDCLSCPYFLKFNPEGTLEAI